MHGREERETTKIGASCRKYKEVNGINLYLFNGPDLDLDQNLELVASEEG
jgi:hypothetical protein